jgi:DNA sulfur modification protein DndD
VQVDFEHDELNYEARRTQKYVRSEETEKKSGAATLELSWTGKDGYKRAENPEVRIKQILPKNLHTYFFFHGERIKELASIDGTDQVRDAIKSLMGIEVVERALSHLETRVKKQFSNEKKRFASAKDAELLQMIDDIDLKIASCRAENSQHSKTIAQAKLDIDIIGRKIAANKETQDLQNRRKRIEEDISLDRERLNALSQDNRRLINTKGLLAFFKSPALEVSSILEDRRKKGELPYKVKRQFITDLLHTGECICGHQPRDGHSCARPIRKIQCFRGKRRP